MGPYVLLSRWRSQGADPDRSWSMNDSQIAMSSAVERSAGLLVKGT